jgi:hypothetical protein
MQRKKETMRDPRQTVEKFRIAKSAYDEILKTVGSRRPESGGILLGSREDFIVRKFVFDPHGSMSAGAYDPNVAFLNKIVKKEWKENGLAFLGFIHSHPRGMARLSGDYGGNIGDVGYLKAIFSAMPTLEKFLVPILFSPADGGELTLFPYIASRGDEENYFTGKLEVIKDKELPPMPVEPQMLVYRFDETRLQGSVDTSLMKKAKIVCIGVGGASGICESLVRTGLGQLTIVDFDTVDASNLATQGFFIDDIGKPKVDALAERLLRINPDVNVTRYNDDITKLSPDELSKLMGRADLLLMMTDDFHAQAYGNLLALQHQVPAIFAVMNDRARRAEITFTFPGVTPACHRCAVSPRYKAYLQDGYTNDVTSVGSTNFHTGYLNNAIGIISLAILHNYTDGLEFSNWFGNYWDQNLIQLRLSPFSDGKLLNELTSGDDRFRFLDSVWQHIEPDAAPKYVTCPDCGGQGDLRESYLFHQNVINEE